MRKAFHPDKNELIDVAAHIRDFGNDSVKEGNRARCPVCACRLSRVAVSSLTTGHFAHPKGSGFCPTKARHAAPYLGLFPKTPDPLAAIRAKTAFVGDWRKHYQQLDWLVKGLAVAEFTHLIQVANKQRIWEYAGLEPMHIPYIFATLEDFPPGRSFFFKGTLMRKCWFRCWFDASVERYDDLWIDREFPLVFWRAWFHQPKGRRAPRAEDLTGCQPLEVSDDFLAYTPRLAPRVESAVSQWLARNFKSEK